MVVTAPRELLAAEAAPSRPARALRRAVLVGRDLEMAALTALLDRRAHVTIVGTAGVGKTRLAREFASQPGRAAFFAT